jgi:S1-C subfamily serine protease
MRKTGLMISLALVLTAEPFAMAQLPPAPPGALPSAAPGMAPRAPQHFVAANLGIAYLPIPYHNGTFGLRLIAPPAAGSPASLLRLNPGDIVFALDGLAFTNPNDVLNHFDQTIVDYVDAMTNTTRRGNIILPPAQGVSPFDPSMANGGDRVGSPPGPAGGGAPIEMGGNLNGPPPGPRGRGPATFVADNLGIRYLPIPLNDGAFGLRLTAAPAPGSPAAQLRLNPGDMVLALDGQPITNPNDLLTHINQTTVDFVNATTNTVLRGVVNLPAPSGPQPAGAAGLSSMPDGLPPPAAAMAVGGGGAAHNASQTSAAGPQPVMSGPAIQRPLYSKNLSIQFVPVSFNDGTLGLRLFRRPNPNTPLAQLELEAGDVIFRLDGQPFNSLDDVSQHWDDTTVDYLDASSNTPRNGTVTLPAQNP